MSIQSETYKSDNKKIHNYSYNYVLDTLTIEDTSVAGEDKPSDNLEIYPEQNISVGYFGNNTHKVVDRIFIREFKSKDYGSLVSDYLDVMGDTKFDETFKEAVSVIRYDQDSDALEDAFQTKDWSKFQSLLELDEK